MYSFEFAARCNKVDYFLVIGEHSEDGWNDGGGEDLAVKY